jgi:hypothetical protein
MKPCKLHAETPAHFLLDSSGVPCLLLPPSLPHVAACIADASAQGSPTQAPWRLLTRLSWQTTFSKHGTAEEPPSQASQRLCLQLMSLEPSSSPQHQYSVENH